MAHSFCSFTQRVGAVNNGYHRAPLDKIGKNGQILAIDFGEQAGHFLADKTRANRIPKHSREQIRGATVWSPTAARDVCTVRLHCAQVVGERAIAHEIKEQIVALG